MVERSFLASHNLGKWKNREYQQVSRTILVLKSRNGGKPFWKSLFTIFSNKNHKFTNKLHSFLKDVVQGTACCDMTHTLLVDAKRCSELWNVNHPNTKYSKTHLLAYSKARCTNWSTKKRNKRFSLKIKAFTQVFKKLLFPFIYLLVWIFSKTKSKNKRKETVRYFL